MHAVTDAKRETLNIRIKPEVRDLIVAAELNLQRFSRSEPVFSSGSVFF